VVARIGETWLLSSEACDCSVRRVVAGRAVCLLTVMGRLLPRGHEQSQVRRAWASRNGSLQCCQV
jgi:hypothetical protein